MKILLAGSPTIAVPTFETIINNFEVVGIVTQPDRAQGRGLNLQATPVAKLGQKYHIPVFKPLKIGEIKTELTKLNFDLMLTFAYGQYIPSFILSLGKYLPLNIHGSLLPKYRGAAPIQRAILNGDKVIGISLIVMTKKMDAGDILFQATQKIAPTTTSGQAFNIISNLADKNIVSWLKKVADQKITYQKQPANFTLAAKITKDEGLITNELTYDQALRKVYGLNPFPGAFIYVNQKRLKLFNLTKKIVQNAPVINLQDGPCYANDYQWEGKKRVTLK